MKFALLAAAVAAQEPIFAPDCGGDVCIKPDPTVPAGHVQATFNARDVAQYNEQWHNWMMHQARAPEAQQLAMHLNQAAKDAAFQMIAARNNIQRDAANNMYAYAKWLNPSANCNVKGYWNCMQRSGQTFEPYRHHPNFCEVENQCTTRWEDASHVTRDQIKHRYQRNERQMETAFR